MEAGLDLVVLVEGDRGGGVAGDRLARRRDMQLERGAPFHHWQGLCLPDVEGRRLELVNQEGFELRNVLLSGRGGETILGSGSNGSGGAAAM